MPEKFEKCLSLSAPDKNAPVLAAWSAQRKDILLAVFNSVLSSVNYSYLHSPVDFDDLSAADFNNDGSPDLLLINKKERAISVALHPFYDTLRIVSKIKVPFEPGYFLTGDYNNDKRLDILIYAQNTPGILPLPGNGTGRFTIGQVIAEDNAVGAVDFAHVNNDNLIDLVIYDWVKSELHILYSIGRGRFIDQSIFPVQGEIIKLTAASIARKNSLDLILRTSDPSGFQIWEGNDFGDFQLKNRVAIDGRITDFIITDLNKDNLNDLIVSVNPASLQIAVNNGGDSFSECVEYACGTDPQAVFAASGQEGYSRNCIVFEKNAGQFIAYCNAGNVNGFQDSILIATGVSPEEITTDDFNNDGISDIALLNVQSRSVSLYFGQKNSVPSGPVFYPLTERPKHIVYHSFTDTTLQFVLSFPQSHQISYLVIDSANNSVLNAFIGTEGDAQIVDVSRNDQRQAEFVTWNRKRTEGNSLRFYEQLGQTTFIERSFHLSKPDILLGAAVTDLNSDKFQDIVYFYRIGDTSKIELGITFGDSTYSMKRRFISSEIPLTTSKQVAVWLFDFDRDGFLDMLIQTGPPDECFMIAGGKGEGYFAEAVRITDSLSISDRSAVQITDVNGDNLPDIVVGAQQIGCVYWLRNENYCNFSAKEILFSENGFNRFAVMDIDADGNKDLALTFSKKGFLKIINGKILQIHMEPDEQ